MKLEEHDIFEVIPEGHIDITAADGDREEDDDFDTSESKPATLSNRRLISGKQWSRKLTQLILHSNNTKQKKWKLFLGRY